MMFLGGILIGTQLSTRHNALASGVVKEHITQRHAMIDPSFSVVSKRNTTATTRSNGNDAVGAAASGAATKPFSSKLAKPPAAAMVRKRAGVFVGGKKKKTLAGKLRTGIFVGGKKIEPSLEKKQPGVVLGGTKKAPPLIEKKRVFDGGTKEPLQTQQSPVSEEPEEESIRDMLRRPPRTDLHFPKTNRTIAACMLAMDDSIRLAEWIAYHYTTLPLGSLTIAIDPDSQSQEKVLEVLDLWKDRIDIKAYTNDSDWLTYKFDEGWGRRVYREDGRLAEWLVSKKGPIYRSQSHKRRQNTFILHCMKRYKKQLNQTFTYWTGKRVGKPKWVLMTDSDEFLTYNYIHADEEDETNYEVKRGTTVEMIDKSRRELIPSRYKIPPKDARVTIADWLAVEEDYTMCWKFPGLRMSSYESTNEARDALVPDGINAQELMTLRFRLSGARVGNFSKTLLDVSWGLMERYTKEDVQNIHNPHKRICGVNGHSGSNADYLSSVFRINHYSSGSLEAFVERGNDRRANNKELSFARFQSRNEINPVHQDDDIRPWIKWFVDKVGIEEAKRLLVDPLNKAYKQFGQHPFVMLNKDKLRISNL